MIWKKEMTRMILTKTHETENSVYPQSFAPQGLLLIFFLLCHISEWTFEWLSFFFTCFYSNKDDNQYWKECCLFSCAHNILFQVLMKSAYRSTHWRRKQAERIRDEIGIEWQEYLCFECLLSFKLQSLVKLVRSRVLLLRSL